MINRKIEAKAHRYYIERSTKLNETMEFNEPTVEKVYVRAPMDKQKFIALTHRTK